MDAEREKSIDEIFEEGTLIDEALRLAARDARIFHKRMGVPMVIVENGKVVWIPPEEIQIDLPEEPDPPPQD